MASMFFVFVAALSIFHLLVGAFVVPLPSDSAAGPSEFLFRPSKETGKGSSTVLHAGYSRGRKRLQNEYREAAGGEDGFNALLESIKTVKVQGGGAASSMSGGDVYSKRREERAWGVKSAKRIGKAAGRGSSGKVRNHSIFTNAKDPFALDDPVLDAERGDGFGGNYGDGGLYGDGRKSRGSRESDSAFFDNPDDAWRQDREKRGGRDDGREGWGERETGGRFSRTGDRESRGANKRSERDRRDGASFGRDRERERRQWDERESFDREEESGPLFPSSSRQRKPIPSLRSPRDRSGRGDADFEEKGRDRMGSPQRQRERSFSGDFDWLEGDGGDRKSSRRGEGGVSYWKGERAGYDDFVPAQLNTMLSHAASHEELMTLLDRHMEKFDYKNYFTALQRLGKVGGKKLNGRESSSNVTVSRLLEKVEAAVDSKPILAPFHAASACWALGKLRIFRASLLLKISEKMSGPTAKDQMKATDVAQIAHGIARMSEAAGGEQWASFLSTGGASSLETLFATLQERFLQTLKQQGSAAPPSQKDLSLFLWSLAKLGGGIAKNQQEMMEAAAQVWSSGIPLGKEKEGKSIDVDMSTVMWAFAKSGALTEGRASPALLSCVRQIANQAQEVWGQGKLPLRALSNLLWSFAQAPEGTLSMEFWGSARGALLDILESSDPSDIQPLSLATCFLAIPNPNTHTATQSPKSKQPQSEKGDEENEEAAARERQSQKAARVRISILHEEVVQKGLEVAIEILTGRKPEREGEYGEGMEENSRGRGMRQRHKKITARPLHRLEPSLIAEMLRAFASAAGGDAASSGSRPTVPFLKQFFRAGADEAARLLPAMTTAQMVSCCHSVARALGTEGGEGVFVSFWSAVLREIQKRGADSLGADDLAIFVWALSDAQPQAALSQFGGPGRSPLVPIGDAVRGAERERKDPWKKETGSPEELDEETDAEEEMDFLSTLCRHATVRASSRELSPKHTAMLIRAFAVLRKSRGNTASLVSRALTASIERLEEFDPHALASLLWALAKFPFARSLWYSKIFPFFKGVAGLIVSRYEAAKGGDKPARKWLRSFSPQATANVIWAFGANLVTGSDVVVKLLTKELVIPQLDRFSYQALCAITWALAAVKHAPEAEMAAVGQSQGLLPSEIAQGEKRAEKHRENLAVLAGKIGDHVCARLTTTLSLVEEGRKAGKRMAASRPLQEVEVEDVMRLASSLSHVGALKEDFFEKAAAVVKAKAKQGIRIRAPLEEESLGHDQTDICMEVSAHDRSGFTVPSAARVEREKGRGRRKRETRGRGRGMMGEEPRVLRHLRGGLSVIYKPPGWTVETSSESFLKQLSKEREEEGWRFSSLGEWLQRGGLGKESSIVSQPTVSHGATHRLDLMTSGPLLVARSMPAWLHGRLLHDSRRISKEYVCLVRGAVPQGPHVETSRLSTERDANSTSPHARVTTVGSPKGVYAETVYTPVAYLTRRESKGEKDVKKTKEKETRGGGLQREIFSLVRVKINTGRTHQIRAHMSHLGFPLLGDRKYLFSLEDAEDEKARHAGLGDESRLFLHCRELTVMRGSLTETEKGGGEEGKSVVRVESALPDDLRKVLKEFKVARRDDKQSRSGLEEVLGFGVGSSTVEYDEEEEEEEEETGENRVQVEEIGSEDVRKEEEVGGLKKSEEEDGEESAEKGEGDETHEVVREDPTKREKGGTSIEKGLSAEEEGEEDAFEYIRSLSLPSLEDEVNSAAVRWPLRQKLRERADRRRAVKREQREKQKKEMTLRQTFEEREALLLPASLRARTQLGEAADGVESQSLPSSSSSKSTELLVPGIFAASPVGSSAEGSQGQEDSARARKTESAFEALQTFLGVENGDEAEEEEGEEGELESLEKGGEEIEKWEFGGDEEDGMTVEDEDEREGVEGGEGGEEEKEEEEEEEIVSLDPQKVLGGLKRLAAIADSSSLSPSSSSPPLLSVTLPSQEIDDSADSLSQTQQEEEEAEENQNSSEHPLDDSVPVPPRRRKEEEDEAIAREEIDRRASLLSVEEEPLQTVGGMEAEEGGGTPEAEGALSTKRIPSPSLLRFRRSAVASRSLQRGKGKGRKKASILKEVETSR